MKPAEMDITDLLADESFLNYCRQSPAVDVAFWEAYIKENPGRRPVVEDARAKFIELFNALAQADLDEQETLLKNKLDLIETKPVIRMNNAPEENKGRKLLPFLLKLSGVAVVLLAAMLFLFNNKNTATARAAKTFVSACGERKNIQLPDGSVVTLNAASKIEIDNSFGISSRNVYLEGEAFFDVKHNETLPFIVHTPMMDVKALGTAFNVRAYLNDKITETSLIRGMIEVTLKESDNRTMVLYPHQKIRWEHPKTKAENIDSSIVQKVETLNMTDSLTKNLKASDSGGIKEIAWTENKLIFEDETFEEIARLLGRWYGVKIHFTDDAIRNYRFTGMFEKEDVNTVLDFLKESRHFNYTVVPGEPITINLSK